MKSYTFSEARQNFAAILEQARRMVPCGSSDVMDKHLSSHQNQARFPRSMSRE